MLRGVLGEIVPADEHVDTTPPYDMLAQTSQM